MTDRINNTGSNNTQSNSPIRPGRPHSSQNRTLNRAHLNEVLSTRPPRSNFNNNRGRSNFNNPQEVKPKTNASVSQRPQFMRRNTSPMNNPNDGIPAVLGNLESIRNIRGTDIPNGNLAISHLNATLANGIKMNTNAKEFYPEGPVVKFIPIGGSSEVGLNMNAIECGDDIIVIDTGLGFGDSNKFPGVDYIAPDPTYLENNKHKIRGIIYTHGHLDHIGAAPYILPRLGPVPIYSMPLTLALLKNRLQEFDIDEKFTAKIINPDEILTLGCFKIQFFRLNHSIPDVLGLGIETPMGKIVFCTDWKFDNTPYDGQLSDYAKLAQFGEEGVRLLMTDSLGVLKPGKTISELDVKKSIMSIFKDCKERVIVTSFASTIPRMQFTVDACIKYNRKLALVGRSMVNNFNICFKLGYIKVPPGLIIDIGQISNLPTDQVCMLMTGSQGEELAALNRLARDEHDIIKLQAGDSVIFSSNPIIGNEKAVQNLVDNLSRKGVDVYSNKEFDIHVSGHACHEDLKLLFALTRPDYIQPIHGDHYIIRKTSELAMSMGVPFEHNLLSENGRVTEMRSNEIVVTDVVVSDGYLLVDGKSVGLVSESVLEERRNMAISGSVVLVLTLDKNKKLVAGPEMISRGFAFAKSGEALFSEIREEVKREFNKLTLKSDSESYFVELRASIKEIASEIIYTKTEKSPMIIPVIIQI